MFKYRTRAHAWKKEIPGVWYPPRLSLLPLLLLFTKIHQLSPLCAMFVVYLPLHLSVPCVCKSRGKRYNLWSITAELPSARRFN